MNIPRYIYCKHDLLKQSQALHKTSESLCFVVSLPWTTSLFICASPHSLIYIRCYKDTGFPSHILP